MRFHPVAGHTVPEGRVGGQRHAPAAFIPGKDLVPIGQEAGWAPGPVWTGVEYLALLGFNPQTIQPVASRYTDCAILAHMAPCTLFKTYHCFGRLVCHLNS